VTAAVRIALAEGAERLAAAGVEGGRAQARWLLAAALGVDATGLARLAPDAEVPAPALAGYRGLIARRAAREPLQHLLGTAPFRTLTLAVGPGVFVPRFETESLVQLVLDRAPAGPVAAVDLGSGSGAIALALAAERPDWTVTAVERSAAALPWLLRNAAAVLGEGRDVPDGGRLRIVEGDFADPGLLAEWHGRVDVVVGNPPYVPADTPVDPEVRADPAEAVFAGADGLGAIAALLPLARALLRPGGLLALEHDETHQDQVLALLAGAGLADATGHRDLTGRPRFATATVPTVPL